MSKARVVGCGGEDECGRFEGKMKLKMKENEVHGLSFLRTAEPRRRGGSSRPGNVTDEVGWWRGRDGRGVFRRWRVRSREPGVDGEGSERVVVGADGGCEVEVDMLGGWRGIVKKGGFLVSESSAGDR